MTHETDDTGRKPEVIDIEAETVEETPPAPEFSRDAETIVPARNKRSIWPVATAGALALGLIGGGVAYREVLWKYFPTDDVSGLSQRLDALQSNDKSERETVERLEAYVNLLKSDVDALNAKLQQAQTSAENATAQVTASTEKQTQFDSVLQKSTKDIADLKSTVAKISIAPAASPADNAALATLSQRIDSLERDIAALKAQKSEAPDTTVLSQSLSDLRAKVAGGVGYAGELDRIRRMVPAADGLDVLQQHADSGLPNAKGLGAELSAAITTLPGKADAQTDDSMMGSVTGFFSRFITIRASGEDDWAARAAEIVVLADAGDLRSAIKLIDGVDGTKPGAIQNFRDRAVARLDLDEALSKASDAVGRHIAAKANGG